MTVKCLIPEEKDRLARAYLAGMKQKDCAEIWGVSPRTVQRVLIEQNILPPEGARILATEAEQEMLKFLREHNITPAKLKSLAYQPAHTKSNIVKTLGTLESADYENILNLVSQVRNTQEVVDAPTLN